MFQFATDLLSGLLIKQTLKRIQLHRTEATRCWRPPSRQHLIPHLRIPMPQPVHVAQSRNFALPVGGKRREMSFCAVAP
jgi:hypothetical protein